MPISTIQSGSFPSNIAIDTDTLVVDGVNNRVGVGTASPQEQLQLTNNAGRVSIFMSSGATNQGYISYFNATQTLSLGNAAPTGTGVNGGQQLNISNSGNVGIGTSAPSGAKLEIFTASTAVDGLKISRYTPGNYYSTLRQDNHGLAVHVGTGGTVSERVAITPNGITFNGDTAAANALDDYEEGTWIPTVSTAASYGVQTGLYTKIGNLVNIQCQVQFVQSGTVFGSVSGLPLVVSSVNYTGITFREWYSTGVTLSGNLTIGSQSTTGFWNYVNNSAATNGQTYGYGFSVTYRT